VQFQTELRHALTQRLKKVFRFLSVLESDYEIIGISHNDYVATSTLSPAVYPQIQNVVKVDIRQNRWNYGYYSNKSRGLRKKADADNQLPTIIPGEMSPKEFRQNWARLIKKIYEVAPLVCPKCQGAMRVISVIEDPLIIKKILKHLGLWETRNHDPPPENSSYIPELTYDDSDSQIPAYDYWT
jgi:hypothetical protein